MAWKDMGPQLRDKFLSKTCVVEARKKRTFSALGSTESQPKHYGDEFYKYVQYPIIHDMNKNDKGIDATGAKLEKNKWYAYDADGNPDAGNPYDTLHEARKATEDSNGNEVGHVLSGNGNIYGGDADFAVMKGGAFPALRETGGLVNRVGMTRVEVHAKVEEYGLYMDFTQRELDLSDEPNLLALKAKLLGEALAEIREKQNEIMILNAAEVNRFLCGDADSIDKLGIDDEVSLRSIVRMQEYMKKARVKPQTKIIDGSQNTDTVVVGKGYFAYFPQGLLPTLEAVKDADGNRVFRPVEMYAAAGTNIHPEEVGKISNTRFIEVEDMAIYKGDGEKVDSDSDDNDDDGSERYQSSTGADGKERYDIYSITYVGDDSFVTIGLSGNVAKVQHAMPKIIPGVDAYGKNGIVSVSWYYGMLVYRPERIAQLLTPAFVA